MGRWWRGPKTKDGAHAVVHLLKGKGIACGMHGTVQTRNGLALVERQVTRDLKAVTCTRCRKAMQP